MIIVVSRKDRVTVSEIKACVVSESALWRENGSALAFTEVTDWSLTLSHLEFTLKKPQFFGIGAGSLVSAIRGGHWTSTGIEGEEEEEEGVYVSVGKTTRLNEACVLQYMHFRRMHGRDCVCVGTGAGEGRRRKEHCRTVLHHRCHWQCLTD